MRWLRGAICLLGTLAAFPAASANDYALIVEGSNLAPICAKSKATCEEARIAVFRGWFLGDVVNRFASTRCVERPGCFPGRSNCIEGFNCR